MSINPSKQSVQSTASYLFLERLHRQCVIAILGFASGLPLALTGTSLQAWLTTANIDVATIGFFSLVGLPYTFKFLWAPLMDRFEPGFLGRRKGWIFVLQLLLAGVLLVLSQLSPQEHTEGFAWLAVLLAFLSASQDVVIDAYRTDLLPLAERGLGASLNVFGYRLAMILSGGIAFVWADVASGNGWSWSTIYQIMSAIMLACAFSTLALLPKLSASFTAPKSDMRNDLLGFIALAAAVIAGYIITTKVLSPSLVQTYIQVAAIDKPSDLASRWLDLASLAAGLLITFPLARFAARRARFETLNRSLEDFFRSPHSVAILLMIVFYKLGDAFAGSLTTVFLLKGVGFSQAEVGVVNKVIGIWLTIIGAMLGGVLMMRLRLYKALMIFGLLQLVSNFGFWLLALRGIGAWGSIRLPAFDLFIVTLKESTSVDVLLLTVIAGENITGGMGTVAFVALLMALCNQQFTATQYALLSALASVGRVWVGPLAGVLTTVVSWPTFFIISVVFALPGIVMLYLNRAFVGSLDAPKTLALGDD